MTAAVIVEPADGRFVSDFAGCDFFFEVTSEALPPFTGPGLGDVAPVESYIKTYGSDPDELVETAAGPDAALFTARLDGQLAGYIALSKAWNGYAEVDDIAVDKDARRAGVARALSWTGQCHGRGNGACRGSGLRPNRTMSPPAAFTSATASSSPATTDTSIRH